MLRYNIFYNEAGELFNENIFPPFSFASRVYIFAKLAIFLPHRPKSTLYHRKSFLLAKSEREKLV